MVKEHEGLKEHGMGNEGGRCGCCQPADEEIRKRAYELWLGRGATHGHDVEDWLDAECELTRARRRQRHGMAA